MSLNEQIATAPIEEGYSSQETERNTGTLARIFTPKSTYTFDYPEAISYEQTQKSIVWFETEIRVDKDIQDIRVNMTKAERHGVIEVLRLFTQYELTVGSEYWGKAVKEMFPRPEIIRMATMFSSFELNIHAPFYNKINEEMRLNTDAFYNSYKEDEVLSARMRFIDEALKFDMNDSLSKLRSIGTFALIEGAVLYSSFAFLKHFQAVGKNRLNNIVAGINFSVRDENLHHEAGAWLFRTASGECNLTSFQTARLRQMILDIAVKIQEHEHRIVEKIFAEGEIQGITSDQMKNFVNDRLNACLENLGYKDKPFTVLENPIANWFFRNINSPRIHDFFVRTGNQYNRDWSPSGFVWKGTRHTVADGMALASRANAGLKAA